MTEKLQNEVRNFNPIRAIIVILAVVAVSYAVAFTLVPVENLEKDGGNIGIWSCVPAVFLVVYIFATKRVLGGTDTWLDCRTDTRCSDRQPDRKLKRYSNWSYDGRGYRLAYNRLRTHGFHHQAYRSKRRRTGLWRMGRKESKIKRGSIDMDVCSGMRDIYRRLSQLHDYRFMHEETD